MHFSILDLFTIGIGPSSSHTVGPMRAAKRFVCGLGEQARARVTRLQCELYGSLAATGKGHGTDRAIILGLLGESPETVEVDGIPELLESVRSREILTLPDPSDKVAARQKVAFNEKEDLTFHRLVPLPRHPNGMHFMALDRRGKVVAEDIV
jgi:L-serine dehydratase